MYNLIAGKPGDSPCAADPGPVRVRETPQRGGLGGLSYWGQNLRHSHAAHLLSPGKYKARALADV